MFSAGVCLSFFFLGFFFVKSLFSKLLKCFLRFWGVFCRCLSRLLKHFQFCVVHVNVDFTNDDEILSFDMCDSTG